MKLRVTQYLNRLWRWGWDSNPRYAHAHNGFRDRPVRPLRHPTPIAKSGAVVPGLARFAKPFVAQAREFAIDRATAPAIVASLRGLSLHPRLPAILPGPFAMYAVLKTGGKQYKVAVNDVIVVEKLPGTAGATLNLDEVLLLGDGETSTVGTPRVAGASVTAQVLEQKRGDKIIVFKKKRRKNYRRTQGHRQDLTVLRITGIQAGGEQ